MKTIHVDRNAHPIRNLFIRPSLEVGSSLYWGFNPLSSTPTLSVPTTGGFAGASFRRATIGTAGSWVNIGHFIGGGGGRVRMLAGRVYTYSMYIRSSVPVNMRANVETYDAVSGGTRLASQPGPTIAIAPNVWTRVYVTLTSVADAWGLLTAYTQNPAMPFEVGDTLDADAVMATEGSTLWEYFDGDSPGCSWLGTAHNSESVGYPFRPVWNLSKNPTAQVDALGYTNTIGSSGPRSSTRMASGGPQDGPFVRFAWTADGPQPYANGGDLMAFGRTEWGGQTPIAAIPVIEGKGYSAAIWVRPSKPISLSLNLMTVTTGQGSINSNRGTALCPANIWTKLECGIYYPPSGIGALRLDVDHMDGTQGWLLGDTLDFANMMICEGPLPDYFYDGNSPGWKWAGTAGSSESYGPALTLNRFGRLNNYTFPGVTLATQLQGDFQGRTLYVVYNTTSIAGSFPTIASWDTSITGYGIRLQHQGVNVANTQLRIDTTAQVNQFLAIAGVRTLGWHTAAVSVAEGIGSLRFNVDNATGTLNLNTGLGLPSPIPRLALGSANEGVIAIGFDGAHDLDTMRKVQAYLARKYGAPVPTGY